MKLSYLPAAWLLTLALPVVAAPQLALAQAPPSPPVAPIPAPVPPAATTAAPPPLSVPGPPAPQPTSATSPPAGSPPYPPPPGAPGAPPTYYSPPAPAGAQPSGPPPGYPPPGYPPPPPGYSYTPAPGSYPPPPPPKPVKSDAQLHNGFYLRMGFGVTTVSGTLETPVTSTSITGVTTRTGETARAKISGPGAGFDFALGGTVFRGLAIACNLSMRAIGSPDVKFEKASPQARTYDQFTVSNIGVMADWYTDPKKGLHIQGGAGIAQVTHSVPSIGRPQGSASNEDARYTGLGLHLGVGYETFVSEEWSVGGLLRVDTASVDSESSSAVTAPNTSIRLFAPSLVFTGTYN